MHRHKYMKFRFLLPSLYVYMLVFNCNVCLFTNVIFRFDPSEKFRSIVVAAFSFPPQLFSSQFERHE